MSEFMIFLNNIFAFPTVIFTALVALVALYWVATILGLSDMDTVDLDIDVDVPDAGDISTTGILTGVMLRLGLYGVPFIYIFSGISIIGWILSYIYSSFLNQHFSSGILHYVFGTGAFILVLVVSMWLTGLMIAPIRKQIEKIPKRDSKSFIGQTAIVRSFTVTDSHGEATLEDGGAGLILKIRAMEGDSFAQNDTVVLLEYIAEENAYRVVSEREYLG